MTRRSLGAGMWGLLMAVWLGALLAGARAYLFNGSPLAISMETIPAVLWLVTGAVAWAVALSYGLQRYRRR